MCEQHTNEHDWKLTLDAFVCQKTQKGTTRWLCIDQNKQHTTLGIQNKKCSTVECRIRGEQGEWFTRYSTPDRSRVSENRNDLDDQGIFVDERRTNSWSWAQEGREGKGNSLSNYYAKISRRISDRPLTAFYIADIDAKKDVRVVFLLRNIQPRDVDVRLKEEIKEMKFK